VTRTNRIALFGAIALLVALAGTTVANRAPVAEDPAPQLADEHETPDPVAIERVVERLDADEARVRELASEHGFGGAVRLLAWEKEGVSIDRVIQRRADGEGWGEIAKDLGVHPGIGSIMGNGGGHGRDTAPGQLKDRDGDD
jgi:hypothetical protein